MHLNLEIDENTINKNDVERSPNSIQEDTDETHEVNHEDINGEKESSDAVSIGVQSDKNEWKQSTIKERKKCKCCADDGCAFDPSCDCWCCKQDLRYWCKVIGILEILLGIILGTLVFLFCIYLPRTQFPSHTSQHHLNITGATTKNPQHKTNKKTTTKKPKDLSNFVNPGAILLIDSYVQCYIILGCIGLLTILSTCLMLVGTSRRKVWALSLFSLVEFLLIGTIIWSYLLTNTILINAFYMYVIFFKIFFIIASIGFITLIRKEKYLKSIGKDFTGSKERQLNEFTPSTFDVYRPQHGIILVGSQ